MNNTDQNLPEQKKQEIQEVIADLTFTPIPSLPAGTKDKSYFSLGNIASWGAALSELSKGITTICNPGGSGLYHVTVPNNMHLASFRNKAGYLGGCLNTSNMVGGQAVLNPVLFDPVMLCVALVLGDLERKLDNIQETQLEIFNFLAQKERSELQGNLNFLTDILNNYKYNFNNDLYKNSNYTKVLDIRQTSEQKINFYTEQIKKQISKKSLFSIDSEVKKHLEKLQNYMRDYQLSVYLYAFSSNVEILLLENYTPEFLNTIINKIEKYSIDYRELYSQVYDAIEKESNGSLETALLKGLGFTSKALGKAAEKIPAIAKTQLDETLINTGDKLKEVPKDNFSKSTKTLVGQQQSYVRPFIDNIHTINKIYNESVELIVDNDKVYLN